MTFSHSVRDLLKLNYIVKRVIKNMVIDIEKLEFMSISTFYEDSNGVIVVENIPSITPLLH